MRKTQILMAVAMVCMMAVQMAAQTADEVVSISGTVRDRDTRTKVVGANVFLPGTGVGTVTNADGQFRLKVSAADMARGVEVSNVGYLNSRLSPEALSSGKPVNVWLIPAVNQINEVYIYGGPARQLVEDALRRVAANYPAEPDMLRMFYREVLQKGHRYVGISEAMMNVYKSDYGRRDVGRDRVQLIRGRRLLAQKADTVAVKVKGGPNLAVLVDIVKNPDALLSGEMMDYYEFRQAPSVMLDDRLHYVVDFVPKMHPGYALFEGRIYIDSRSMALTRAEYNLDMSRTDQATAAVLYKKPAGLRFRPYEVSFVVGYRQVGERSCLNYVRNVMRFRCDWHRRLFSSVYTACSEMVVVDREQNPQEGIRWRDSFTADRVFTDAVGGYTDVDYWRDYNIIRPTESLENAVRKLMAPGRSAAGGGNP